ncbi:glycosyltransferase family 4 protein [Candidatus Giovannonibacteria bacterium]|nr:glycosyltransferase family 4 protein [Candidatus Giovannonibacteria bacterium]
MRSVILYAYPPEPDGLSMQGDMLYRGMKENGKEVMPCNLGSEFQKEWLYKYFKPDAAIGVGFWSHTPDLVTHTQQFGVTPVPWLVADGWVANYRKELESLPLVLATSQWVKDTYKRDGVDTKNFEVAHIGCETEIYKPIPRGDEKIKLIRKMIGVEEDELMILTAGGDVTSKGAQEIFKALKTVDKTFKKWKYVCKVWGGDSADDHYDDEMKLISELGDAKDKVIYVEGPLSREFMPFLLNAADIYAAPSRLEGFGMIQVEAQACGVPVISINEMGPKDTIVHGVTGFLAKVGETVELTEEWVYPHMGYEEKKKVYFPEGKIFAYRADENELADYLLKLLTNDELRNKMGRAARRHAVENFEYHKKADLITNLVKKHLKLS